MLKEEIRVLWRTAAICLGAALPLLLIGRAVMFILVVLGVLFGFMATNGSSLRSSIKMLFKSTLFRLILVMYGAFFVSSVMSIDVRYSLEHWLQLVGMGAGASLLFVVFREMPSQYTRLALQVLGITTIFVMALCLLDAFWADPRLTNALHGDKAQNLHRLNYMSSTLAVLLPFFWGWLMRMSREQDLLAQRFAVLLSMISVWTVFVCGGRIGWVAVCFSAFIFLVYASRYHNLVLHSRHWFIGAIAVISGPFAYGLSRGWDVMIERVNMVAEPMGFGSGRLEIWSFALDHMMDSPLTGIGLAAFRKLPVPAEGIASNAHPHNFIIQLALETGVIGTISALVVIAYILLIFWRYARKDVYGLAGFCALLAFFTASLANTSLFQAWWLMFFIFAAIFAGRIGWAKS